jgi:hypothetical protein
MSERSAEEICQEIAAERQGLADELDVLRGRARSLLAVVVVGTIAVLVLFRGKYLKPGLKLLWKLR